MTAILFSMIAATLASGVRTVTATSCDIIPVFVSLGMTTQIIFEQEPAVSLFADEKHFRIETTPSVPRSIAIIPQVSDQELDSLINTSTEKITFEKAADLLNAAFNTNLFVFFKKANQLMFKLQFVARNKADYALKVKQEFKESCQL